jgi:hypothetical protein
MVCSIWPHSVPQYLCAVWLRDPIMPLQGIVGWAALKLSLRWREASPMISSWRMTPD